MKKPVKTTSKISSDINVPVDHDALEAQASAARAANPGLTSQLDRLREEQAAAREERSVSEVSNLPLVQELHSSTANIEAHTENATMNVMFIVPSKLNANVMDPDYYKSYVADVRAKGQIDRPILVRPIAHNGSTRYEIIDGHHTFKAAVEAGLINVPVIIREMDHGSAIIEGLKHNNRGNANPLILARQFAEPEIVSLTNVQIAELLGWTEGTVRNYKLYKTLFDASCIPGLNANLTEKELEEYISAMPVSEVRAVVNNPEEKLPKLIEKIADTYMEADPDARPPTEAEIKASALKEAEEIVLNKIDDLAKAMLKLSKISSKEVLSDENAEWTLTKIGERIAVHQKVEADRAATRAIKTGGNVPRAKRPRS